MEDRLTEQELNERIAILRRFRALLEKQRAKFNEYLKILELQEQSIENEDKEAIISHTELGNQIVSNISSLQKVIVPLESLYLSSGAGRCNPSEARPIREVLRDLDKLKVQVQDQNEKNQELLKIHMAEIRQQMSGMRNPYRNLRSIYAEKKESGTIMNIEA